MAILFFCGMCNILMYFYSECSVLVGASDDIVIIMYQGRWKGNCTSLSSNSMVHLNCNSFSIIWLIHCNFWNKNIISDDVHQLPMLSLLHVLLFFGTLLLWISQFNYSGTKLLKPKLGLFERVYPLSVNFVSFSHYDTTLDENIALSSSAPAWAHSFQW